MKKYIPVLIIFLNLLPFLGLSQNETFTVLDSLRDKILEYKETSNEDSLIFYKKKISQVWNSMSKEKVFEYELYNLEKSKNIKNQLEVSKSKSQMQSLVLFMICLLGFIYLIRFTDRKSRDAQIRKLNAASKISSYELELKRRISERLHDDIGGSIAALKMQLSKNKNLKNETKVIDSIYNNIRMLSQDLDSQNKLYPSIKTSAQDLVEEMCKSFKKTTLNIFPEKEIEKISSQVLNHNIILTLKELITNTIKHADAKNISIDISKQENEIVILVQDDGVGFDFTKKEGQGLKSIRNRCVLNEGELFIDSNKENGTTITVTYKI